MVIKKLYLDPFLDMFNGEVLSYDISKSPSATSILSANNVESGNFAELVNALEQDDTKVNITKTLTTSTNGLTQFRPMDNTIDGDIYTITTLAGGISGEAIWTLEKATVLTDIVFLMTSKLDSANHAQMEFWLRDEQETTLVQRCTTQEM